MGKDEEEPRKPHNNLISEAFLAMRIDWSDRKAATHQENRQPG
jgi:hypothetical protein